MKKLIFVFGLLLFNWFIFSANLFISPAWWAVWSDCIEEFNIVLDVSWWEKIIASDIIIDSNMEFVSFTNWDVFEYSAPVKHKKNLSKLLLFSSKWNEVIKWWNIWKIYFKVPSNISSPYINFVFDGVGKTTDTNLSIDWVDILSSVRNWKYKVDINKECSHALDDDSLWNKENLNEFIDRFESDNKIDAVKRFIFKYKIILFFWVTIILALVILFIFKSKRKKEQPHA